jgi:hypothetical protein
MTAALPLPAYRSIRTSHWRTSRGTCRAITLLIDRPESFPALPSRQLPEVWGNEPQRQGDVYDAGCHSLAWHTIDQ